MLRRWAVREHTFRVRSISQNVGYLSDCLQILHTTPLGGLVASFEVYQL